MCAAIHIFVFPPTSDNICWNASNSACISLFLKSHTQYEIHFFNMFSILGKKIVGHYKVRKGKRVALPRSDDRMLRGPSFLRLSHFLVRSPGISWGWELVRVMWMTQISLSLYLSFSFFSSTTDSIKQWCVSKRVSTKVLFSVRMKGEKTKG